MSKTKPAKEQTSLDWFHEMTAGYSYQTARITESFLEALQTEAAKAGINLNSAAEQMFRVSPDQLSNEQGQQLLRMLCVEAAKAITPRHAHHCVECGGIIPCFEPEGCTETEGECRACHEGMRGFRQASTWYHKREVIAQ
jgi:hypothetical protein